MPPSSAFLIVFFILFCSLLAFKGYRDWQGATNTLQRAFICFSSACMLAFIAPLWISFFPPKFLEHIELPNAPFGDRLTAPDGRVFIVSPPFARVQRYGPQGFELGFMYGDKASKSWVSPSGDVLICTLGGALLTYSPDGTEMLPRRSCSDRFEAYFSSSPSRARVPIIALNWFSALAVPLWHPIVAWLTMLVTGLFVLGFGRRLTL